MGAMAPDLQSQPAPPISLMGTWRLGAVCVCEVTCSGSSVNRRITHFLPLSPLGQPHEGLCPHLGVRSRPLEGALEGQRTVVTGLVCSPD